MYHRQQNKCYPQSYLPSHLETTLDFSVANLLAHNNISQICYWGQISLQSAVVNCRFSDNLTPLGVAFILLVMVPRIIQIGSWIFIVANFEQIFVSFVCEIHCQIDSFKEEKYWLDKNQPLKTLVENEPGNILALCF